MNILVVSKKSLLFLLSQNRLYIKKEIPMFLWILLNVHAENRLKLSQSAVTRTLKCIHCFMWLMSNPEWPLQLFQA